MAEPIHLTSADNPRVKAALRLRRQRERQRSGLFIAEGVREVSRALDAGLVPRELFWCDELLSDRGVDRDRLISRWSGGPFFTVTASLMSKLAYRQNPEGILGVFEQPQYGLTHVAGGAGCDTERGLGLWLVAVGTQKPGNLGAMARSAEAAGCNGVFVCSGVVDAFNPNAIRASTGAVFDLPIVAAAVDDVLASLDAWGARVVIASPDASSVYTDVDLTGPVALVVGPEDVGFGTDALPGAGDTGSVSHGAVDTINKPQGRVCRVSIPMLGRTVDSLNASVAASVLLFEAVRQRCGGRS